MVKGRSSSNRIKAAAGTGTAALLTADASVAGLRGSGNAAMEDKKEVTVASAYIGLSSLLAIFLHPT